MKKEEKIYRFRKREIETYNQVIDYIRRETRAGRNFWASLFDCGLTFTKDIKRFCYYASQVGALDISEEILKQHKGWI